MHLEKMSLMGKGLPAGSNGGEGEETRNREQEFEEVALPYLGLLLKVALRLTRNRADAEDLVQTTYLKAFRFFHRFETGTNCRAWLFRILRNTFINRYRKEAREPKKVDIDKVDEFLEMIRVGANIGGVKEEVYRDLLGDEVTAALKSLPKHFREVVILSDIEDCSYREIAETIGTPVGTVRSRLSRARQMLRQRLSNYAKQQGYGKRGKYAEGVQETSLNAAAYTGPSGTVDPPTVRGMGIAAPTPVHPPST